MDLLRRVGGGRLSEIFGPDMIENDKFLRTLGIAENSKKSAFEFLEKGDKKLIKKVNQYLNGINYFIENETLPLEYKILQIDAEKFKVEDVYQIAGYMGYSFATALKTDPLIDWINHNLDSTYTNSMSLNPLKNNTKIPTKYPEIELCKLVHKLDSKLPVGQFIGSNSWVIAAEKSKSKKVLFANDAHIGFASPSVWWEAHIVTPEVEYYGNHLAGFPFPLIGHTRNHAWGLTMFTNDDIDLYREKINGDKVTLDNEFYDLKFKKEIIKVKGGDDVDFTIRKTKNGPIISDVVKSFNENENIALWWTYTQYGENKLLEASYKFSRAEDIKEFEQACSLIHAPGLNIMYGDAKDNIAWWASAKLPMRPEHVNSKNIIDGSKSNNLVKTFYSFSFNPQNVNPDSHYVYSANNQPVLKKGIDIPGYYYSGNTRAATIMKEIENLDGNGDNEFSKNLQLNDYSPVFDKINKTALSKIDITTLNSLETEAYEVLKKWDSGHKLDQIAPVIFYKWMYKILANTYKDELGEENFKLYMSTIVWERSFPLLMEEEDSPWWDNIDSEQKENIYLIINKSFVEAISNLEKQLGKNIGQWQWGKVHTLTHKHALGSVSPLDKVFNVGNFPIESGKDALNKMSFPFDDSGLYNVSSGPSMRIVIDFADIENSQSVIPTGQSGNVMSEFYSDQAPLYNSGKYRKQMMNFEEIRAEAFAKAYIKTNN